MKSFLSPLKKRSFIFFGSLFTISYFLLQASIFNYQSLNQVLTHPYPLTYKTTLIAQLILGFPFIFPLWYRIFFFITTFLVGVNVWLTLLVYKEIKRSGSRKWSFGGVNLVAVASTGCSSCGLTLFSFLGPTSGIISIAFNSLQAHIVIMLLLLFSIIYSLKKIQRGTQCAR
ncbi:MAG: hypothetical protein HZC02_02970 [Candidatus Levybacteria bacterium]|nr:hypothetical protein [Candidatus Levybacteria bacterium]